MRNGVIIYMITENHTQKVLFEPLADDVNELYILSGYATPTMLSWFIKNLYHKVHTPLRISLMIGMVPFDGISASVHEGFVQQVREAKPQEVEKLECSYIYDEPCVHANLYIWAKNGIPVKAYTGSAFFVQRSFVGQHRQEIMLECDPVRSFEYWNSQIDRSIYVQHAEVEEYVQIHPTHPILDMENALVDGFDIQHQERYETVRLSLVTRTGEPGIHSGLNWGQREGRNPNEAYISLPSRIAKSGFFPLEKRHFTAITDDRHQLILRIEQQNDKAITTPARNSDLGEYFRNRLGIANGAPVTRADLDRYGRTDVVFLKLDDETFYMDFNVI